MDVEKIIHEKKVTITNNGMICIPAAYRKLYDLNDGDKILVVEDEGALKLIPIKDLDELRKNSYSSKDIIEHIRQRKKEEIEREK